MGVFHRQLFLHHQDSSSHAVLCDQPSPVRCRRQPQTLPLFPPASNPTCTIPGKSSVHPTTTPAHPIPRVCQKQTASTNPTQPIYIPRYLPQTICSPRQTLCPTRNPLETPYLQRNPY